MTDLVMLDGLHPRPAFTVAGLERKFDLTTRREIPLLWESFIGKLPLPGQQGRETFGVEWGMNGKDFYYMAAVAVAPDATLSQGFARKDLAAQNYIVFRLTLDGSDFQNQMHAGADRVWSEWAPKNRQRMADAPDFEFYPADFDPTRKGARVEFWIPAKG